MAGATRRSARRETRGPEGHGGSRSAGRAALVGLVIGLSLASGRAASAQYLAQSGNALSGGLARNNPYASSGRDFAAEAKYRNSIVFRQAPGGMSFQGRMGYSDPSEFVGRLGSSSLSGFNRNSELSRISAQGVTRSQAIDAQNALAGGGVARGYQPGRGGVNFSSFYTPQNNYGRPADTQGAFGVAPSYTNTLTDRANLSSALKRDVLLDRSYNAVNRLSAPVNTGTGAGTGTPRLTGLGSSSAYSSASRSSDISERLGVTSPTTRISNLDFGRTDYGAKLDGERTLANSATARGQSDRALFDSQRSRSRVDAARPGSAPSGRIDTSARPDLGTDAAKLNAQAPLTSYDELRKKLDSLGIVGNAPVPGLENAPSERGPGEPAGAARDWRERLDNLRLQLLNPDDTRPEHISLLDRSKRASRPGEFRPIPSPQAPQGDEPADENAPKGDPALRSRIDPETLKMIRDASGRVGTFISSGTGKRDFYTEHMETGQRLLRERMYFDAEERFGRALSNKSGDVSARTGQIHAQVGAGLWMSAGQRLRQLIAEHPETAGQRYAPELLPDPDRMSRATDQLRINVAGTGKVRRESALLIAYMGFQAGDLAMAREGLDAMARVAAEDPAAGSDERLVELLRGVWLDPALYTPATGAGARGGATK